MDRSEVHQFLRINDFGGKPKTGPHYLTLAHTSSAAARLQLFPFKPGFLFVLGDLIDRSPTRHVGERKWNEGGVHRFDSDNRSGVRGKEAVLGPMDEIVRLAAACGAASRLLTNEISWSIYSSGIYKDAGPLKNIVIVTSPALSRPCCRIECPWLWLLSRFSSELTSRFVVSSQAADITSASVMSWVPWP